MNKLELIERIKASQISENRKQEILGLLVNNDLNQDVKDQIKDIIQADIDSDTSIPLTPEDKTKIEAITAQTSQELSAVEEGLNQDMKFVEKELTDLEDLVNNLDKLADEADIDSIRKTI